MFGHGKLTFRRFSESPFQTFFFVPLVRQSFSLLLFTQLLICLVMFFFKKFFFLVSLSPISTNEFWVWIFSWIALEIRYSYGRRKGYVKWHTIHQIEIWCFSTLCSYHTTKRNLDNVSVNANKIYANLVYVILLKNVFTGH